MFRPGPARRAGSRPPSGRPDPRPPSGRLRWCPGRRRVAPGAERGQVLVHGQGLGPGQAGPGPGGRAVPWNRAAASRQRRAGLLRLAGPEQGAAEVVRRPSRRPLPRAAARRSVTASAGRPSRKQGAARLGLGLVRGTAHRPGQRQGVAERGLVVAQQGCGPGEPVLALAASHPGEERPGRRPAGPSSSSDQASSAPGRRAAGPGERPPQEPQDQVAVEGADVRQARDPPLAVAHHQRGGLLVPERGAELGEAGPRPPAFPVHRVSRRDGR